MISLADRIISFLAELDFRDPLPEGISVLNPYRNKVVFSTVKEFYRKYYSDNRERHLILGINPGRFGAGATGIPFTDTVRLTEKCGLTIPGLKTYETSSVFIYDMIDRYGGPEKFYGDFLISSVSPLGFTFRNRTGHDVNYNYYDSRELTAAVYAFILGSLRKQIEFGIMQDVCFCLGSRKNHAFISKLNSEHRFFKRIEALEHPRFIMQYRLKSRESYLSTYIKKLKNR